jgi:hypothetical protein
MRGARGVEELDKLYLSSCAREAESRKEFIKHVSCPRVFERSSNAL